MKVQNRYIFSLLLLFATLVGCSEYQEIIKSDDYNLKMQKAKQYYEAGQYYRAQPLFEELVDYYKGTKEMEDIYYYYAYTYYQQGEYLVAAYHFKNFASTYPANPKAEECLFMNAKCYYQISPDVELEQSYTEKAITELQLFVNEYPSSKYVVDANQMIDDMRGKLEMKSFLGAELYFRMGKYKAAAVAFQNMLKDYPDSPEAERAMFMIVKSNYLYALNSVTNKQKERYQSTITSYQVFATRYSSSTLLPEAKNIYEASLKNIDKIKPNEQE